MQTEGFPVWWDVENLPSGESFNRAIQQALESSKRVVVLWSDASIKSDYVEAEAYWAWQNKKLHSVQLGEAVVVAVPFNTSHARNLAAWDGSPDFPEFRRLTADLVRIIGPRAPAPTAPSVPEQLVTPAASAQAPEVAEPEVDSPPPRAKGRRAPARKAQASRCPEPEMVRIEPGTFLMGSAKGPFFLGFLRGEAFPDECPQHEVRIARPFGIGRYPVTFEEYAAFAEATQREPPGDEGWGRGTRPVINVSWEDAVAYVQWLSEQTEKSYRLPTEAEWEYAARAGTSTAWSFGDDKQTLHEFAWYSKNAEGKTHPVGEKAANPWDLHDVHGNVWEWVQDCWHGGYEGAPKDGSAWLEADGGNCGLRVVRGGSWSNEPESLRSANRGRFDADGRYSHIGFRLAQDL